jgi:hypothetical protein
MLKHQVLAKFSNDDPQSFFFPLLKNTFYSGSGDARSSAGMSFL